MQQEYYSPTPFYPFSRSLTSHSSKIRWFHPVLFQSLLSPLSARQHFKSLLCCSVLHSTDHPFPLIFQSPKIRFKVTMLPLKSHSVSACEKRSNFTSLQPMWPLPTSSCAQGSLSEHTSSEVTTISLCIFSSTISRIITYPIYDKVSQVLTSTNLNNKV